GQGEVALAVGGEHDGEGVADARRPRLPLDQLDGAGRGHGAGREHPQVPAAAGGGDHAGPDVATAGVEGELVARRPGLADLHERLAPAEHVAEQDVALGQPGQGDVLAQVADVEGEALVPPGRVVVDRVDVDGLVGPAVDPQVGLAVAGQVGRAELELRGVDPGLGDGAAHDAAAPAPERSGTADEHAGDDAGDGRGGGHGGNLNDRSYCFQFVHHRRPPDGPLARG